MIPQPHIAGDLQGKSMNKLSIGAVGFGRPSTKNFAGWEHTDHIGDERVRLLQLVRDGKPLPEPLFLVGQRHGGYTRITPDEINWKPHA